MLVGHPFDTVKVSVLSRFYSQVFVEAQASHRDGVSRRAGAGGGPFPVTTLGTPQGLPIGSGIKIDLGFCDTQVDSCVSAFLLGLALHLAARG